MFSNLPSHRYALGLVQSPDGSQWYTIDQRGRIHRYNNVSTVNTSETIIDISSSHINSYFEGGLLGMAFDQDFATNGYVYLSYTTSDDSNSRTNDNETGTNFRSVISRVYFNEARTALEMSTEKIILELPQPFWNHNGGHIVFGQDQNLYIGFGDGGGSNMNESLNTINLYGSMLRIVVTGVDETQTHINYTIPSGNQLSGTCNGVDSDCPEIFAWGLRNP